MVESIYIFIQEVFEPFLQSLLSLSITAQSYVSAIVLSLAAAVLTLIIIMIMIGRTNIKDAYIELLVVVTVILFGTNAGFLQQINNIIISVSELYPELIGGSYLPSKIANAVEQIELATDALADEQGWFKPPLLAASAYIGLIIGIVPVLMLYSSSVIGLYLVAAIYPVLLPFLLFKATREYASRILSAIVQMGLACYAAYISIDIFTLCMSKLLEQVNYADQLTWSMMFPPIFYGVVCAFVAHQGGSIASSLSGGMSTGISASAAVIAGAAGGGTVMALSRGTAKAASSPVKATLTANAMRQTSTLDPSVATAAKKSAKSMQSRRNYQNGKVKK